LDNHIAQQNLVTYGWNQYWEDVINTQQINIAGLELGRVVAQFSKQYRLITELGEVTAGVTGKFEYNATDRCDFPSVGDWVVIEHLLGESRAVIHAVLPRRSAMIRKEAGNRVDGQVIGANMDFLFIVNALNQDFNLRKIERYLVAAWESQAQPVILLTKADLCSNPDEYISLVHSIAPGVPVHTVSAVKDLGMDELSIYLTPGSTVAIIGSSGVGKSTLLNWFADQDLQTVQSIRENDARGRHTTTHRELFVLPNGSIMIDTPGMRELQLWDTESGWHTTFADIEKLALACRYRDCQHQSESGCAVKQAIEGNELDSHRYANYLKTKKELNYLARKEQTVNQQSRRNNKKPKKGFISSE
jgi:ribosome biogenesis GTPase